MAFKDYSEFIQPPLELPWRGKKYTVPTPDVQSGLVLTRGKTAEGAELDEADIEEQYRVVLGPAYDEMLADRVPAGFVARCFLTALADFQLGREVAEATWEVGADPEAVAAWIRAKHPEAQAAATETPEPTASTSTDEETATP